jgi:hypothetical protein
MRGYQKPSLKLRSEDTAERQFPNGIGTKYPRQIAWLFTFPFITTTLRGGACI